MLIKRGSHRRMLLLILLACQVVEPAFAQLSKPEKERIGVRLANEVDRWIKKYPNEGVDFRERVIGRLGQCGFIFTLISKQGTDLEAKQRISDVAEISFDVSARVSSGISIDRFKTITDAAYQTTKEKFAAQRTPAAEQEMNGLLNNCKAFHKIDEIPRAVAALLPSVQQQNNATPIEFAYELQECSLYYSLFAGGLLVQVPQNSGPLSPADTDKAVKSQVYMTKAEQIEVLYKRLALLAGVTESSLITRRDRMFEQEKRVMGGDWNLDRLHERYKDFCEYILSDTGSKARLKEITQGNVCGRLYTCWR